MAVSAWDVPWLFEVRWSPVRSHEDEGTSYREQFVPTLLTTVGLSLQEEVEDGSPHWPSVRNGWWGVPHVSLQIGSCGIFCVILRKVFTATWCMMWGDRILEGAINQSLFGLVVPVVVILYLHINSFWVAKDLTRVCTACANGQQKSAMHLCCVCVLTSCTTIS